MLVLFLLTKVYGILHKQLSVPPNRLFFFQAFPQLQLQGVDGHVIANVAQQQKPGSRLQGHLVRSLVWELFEPETTITK